jgi:hypothetical protein
MSEKSEIVKSELLPEYAIDVDGLKVSKGTLEKLGRHLAERHRRLSNLREQSKWEIANADSFDAYHMVPPKKDLPYAGAPNLRCPYTRIAVDSLVANDKYALFGQDNFCRIEPDYVSKDFIQAADKGAKYLTYCLRYEADFYTVVDDALKKARIFGVAYLEPRYEKQEVWETRKVEETIVEPIVEQVMDPLTGEVSEKLSIKERKTKRTTKDKKTLFDGIKLESIPVENILVSNFFRTIQDAVAHDVVFKKVSLTLKKIKDRTKLADDKKPFYIDEQVKQIEHLVTKRMLDKQTQLEQAREALDGFDLEERCDQESVDLEEAHLWYDVDGDGLAEKVMVTIEPRSGVIIRVALAPCRIEELRPYPMDERFMGERVFDIIKHAADEWESIHNGRVIKNDWSNNAIFFYRSGGKFNPQEVTLVPGHGYPMDSPTDVYFPQIQGPGPSGYQEEAILTSLMERLLGLSENMQGVTTSRDITATENLNLNQKAGIRSSSPLGRIVTSLERVLDHIWELNAECAPEEKEFYVVGKGQGVRLFDRITRSDFNVRLKFKFNIASIHDQQVLRDTWLMAFRMFRQDPLIMSHPAAAYDLFKNTLKGMNIHLDIPKPPQADALSPLEEQEMFQKGEMPEPVPGEDYDEHLKQHMAWLQTESFRDWDEDAQQAFLEHIDKTKILKQTLEAANLNKSGVFEGMPQGAEGMEMPGMTASQNPSQMMNNMRVGETSKSAMQNNQNGGY